MAQLSYAILNSETVFTESSDAYVAKYTIPGSSLDANRDYILMVSAQIGGDDTGIRPYRASVFNGGTQLGGSLKWVEPSNNLTSNGHSYFFLKKITTSGTPSDISFRLRGPTGFIGTNFTHSNRCMMLAMKLHDADPDGLNATDYKYSEASAEVDITVANQWEDGESVVAGNGTDDWAAWMSGQVSSGSFSGTQRGRLDIGGVFHSSYLFGRGDSDDLGPFGAMTYLPALANATTCKSQFTSNSTLADIGNNAIFMLRMNAFENWNGIRNTVAQNITPADTDVIRTLTHVTSTAATRTWLFLGSGLVTRVETGKRIDHFMDQAGVLFSGDHSGRYNRDKDASAITSNILMGSRSIANGVDVDVDFGVQEESDVTPAATLDEVVIVGFSTELVTGPNILSANDSGIFTANPEGDLSLISQAAFEVQAMAGLESASAVAVPAGSDAGTFSDTESFILSTGTLQKSGASESGTISATESSILDKLSAAAITATDNSSFSATETSSVVQLNPIATKSGNDTGTFSGVENSLVAPSDLSVAASDSSAFSALEDVVILVTGTSPKTGSDIGIFAGLEIPNVTKPKVASDTFSLISATETSQTPIKLTFEPGWEDDDIPWGGLQLGSKDFAPVFVDGQFFYVLGRGSDQYLDHFIERRAVVFESGRILLGRGVYLQVIGPSGQKLKIWLGGHETPDGAIDWEGPYDFEIGVDSYKDFAVSGKYLAVKFAGNQIPTWQLQAFDVDYEVVGAF